MDMYIKKWKEDKIIKLISIKVISASSFDKSWGKHKTI